MTHKQKRMFFTWLQKHKALKAFKAARHKECNHTSKQPWQNYGQLSIEDPFCWAFSWARTPQGGLYWENLCIKWFIYYHHNTGLFV